MREKLIRSRATHLLVVKIREIEEEAKEEDKKRVYETHIIF